MKHIQFTVFGNVSKKLPNQPHWERHDGGTAPTSKQHGSNMQPTCNQHATNMQPTCNEEDDELEAQRAGYSSLMRGVWKMSYHTMDKGSFLQHLPQRRAFRAFEEGTGSARQWWASPYPNPPRVSFSCSSTITASTPCKHAVLRDINVPYDESIYLHKHLDACSRLKRQTARQSDGQTARRPDNQTARQHLL